MVENKAQKTEKRIVKDELENLLNNEQKLEKKYRKEYDIDGERYV